MIFADGYIPDEVQMEEARKLGVPSDREKLLAEAKGFDDAGKMPPVTSWPEFYEYVKKLPDAGNTRWWEGVNVDSLFTPSQGTRPNCAGFSMANASLIRILLQKKNEFSEQVPVRFNPQGTWQSSKNGSTRGGQTISAIADAGRRLGNCLASDLGNYDDSQSFRSLDETVLENAARHQIGISLYDGPRENVPEIIMTLCRKGFSIIVGNCTAAADGRRKDANGVECVDVSRQEWAHATCFGGYQEVGGKRYVFWVNSHGNIYPASDGSPAFGGWMPEQTLLNFVQGQFFDLAAVVYAEANFCETAEKTLNPWR